MHSSLENNCFEGVSGKLYHMPSSFRKWRGSLQEYRSNYMFMHDSILRESAPMLRMSFDYQYSLYLWLKPNLVFRDHHELVLYQIIAQIYEALLGDYLKMQSSKMTKGAAYLIVTEWLESKNKGLGSYVEVLNKSKDSLIDNGWGQYLLKICELRNTMHPSKLTKFNRINNKTLKSGLDNAAVNLDNFIKNIRRQY